MTRLRLRGLAALLLAAASSLAQTPAAPAPSDQRPSLVKTAPLMHIGAQAKKINFPGGFLTRRETEFDSKTGVWSVFFDPEGDSPGTAVTGLIMNFYGWDPPSSPLSVAQALISRSGTYRTIFKFQAPDPETGAPAYFIYLEDIRAEKGYGYADIAKVAAVGTGAYAVTFSHKISGKTADDIDKNIKAWLLTPEAKAAEEATSNISADADWRDALNHQH